MPGIEWGDFDGVLLSQFAEVRDMTLVVAHDELSDAFAGYWCVRAGGERLASGNAGTLEEARAAAEREALRRLSGHERLELMMGVV